MRKVVSKEKSMVGKYAKLKQQFTDLQRLASISQEIIPKLYAEDENSFEYFYDMEFLSDHDLLANLSVSDKLKAVQLLLKKMANHVYARRAYLSPAHGNEWLTKHLATKIYPKLRAGILPPKLFSMVSNDYIFIDGLR